MKKVIKQAICASTTISEDKIASIVDDTIVKDLNGELWDNYAYGSYSYQLPSKGASMSSVMSKINHRLIAKGYNSMFMTSGLYGSVSDKPTRKILVEDPKDSYHTVTVLISTDTDNSEPGYKFYDIDIEESF